MFISSLQLKRTFTHKILSKPNPWLLCFLLLFLSTIAAIVSIHSAFCHFCQQHQTFSCQDWLLRPLPFPATSLHVPHPSACYLPLHMKFVKNRCESSYSPELLCSVKTNILTTLNNVLSALKWHKKTCKRLSFCSCSPTIRYLHLCICHEIASNIF